MKEKTTSWHSVNVILEDGTTVAKRLKNPDALKKFIENKKQRQQTLDTIGDLNSVVSEILKMESAGDLTEQEISDFTSILTRLANK